MLEARVGLVEAGGGYGKSVLVSEVRRALATPSAVAIGGLRVVGRCVAQRAAGAEIALHDAGEEQVPAETESS